jgi:CRP/FNR family transcriptional regulator, cyclic AMP receptor protein
VWVVVAGWLASVLVFAAFFMKLMTPLRLLAVASNLAFMSYALLGLLYGDFGRLYPIFVLHTCLLPLNLFRLRQLRRLVKAVGAANDEQVLSALIPYMKLEEHGRDEVLFRRGDPADRLYVLQRGAVSFPEMSRRSTTGAVFGEVGLFSPQGVRSATAVCEDDCLLATIDRQTALELAYQDRDFAMFLLRLVAGRADGERLAAPAA